MSVFTAVRLLPTEQSNNDWVATSSKTIAFEDKEHVFDHVFSAHNNVEVYDSSCRMIVERIIEGFNGTIAAYGQSGAGKTHSLLGTNDEKGVLQLAGSHLLRLINKRLTVQYMVKMSAFEIYNETLVDLLDESDSNSCRIIGDKVVGGVEEIVESNEHFLEICQKAQAHRRVGETKLNQKSSRSHAVFQLIVESCHLDVHTRKQSTTVSKLVVLDLAGSENARTMSNSMQSAESRKINLSLLALSRVISDLADNPATKCLPFRDSLLTRILKPVLGGNSHFLLLCCIRKSASSETASTISFGQKTKKMPNHAKKNVETGEAALPALLAEITDLKRQLEEQKKESADQDKLRLEVLLKKVLNAEPEIKKPTMSVTKRRHSIAFGGGYSSVINRHPRLSFKTEWNDELGIREKGTPLENYGIREEEGSSKSREEVLDEKENASGTPMSSSNADEKKPKIIETYERALIEETEKSRSLEAELALREQEVTDWKQRASTFEEKYIDLKKRGLQMLESKDERMKRMEVELAQKLIEHKAAELELREEKTKRSKLMKEMVEARSLVEAALEEERQLRKEKEVEHLTERSERKALQDKLQEMTAAKRGIVGPGSCSIAEHAVLSDKCDVLIRQRDILIASLNERSGGREDNYEQELHSK